MTLAVADSWRRNGRVDLADIKATVKQLLVGLVQDDLQKKAATNQQTAGELQYRQYGLTGIRGEAQAGYPTVFDHGLPTMHCYRWRVEPADYPDDARPCSLHRGFHPGEAGRRPSHFGTEKHPGRRMSGGGRDYDRGGRAKLAQLEQEFTAKHLSLGGTADLLIVTIFLTLVKEELADGLSNE
jgi:holo-ACP synthase / triphosphoribosyl-dephospho-CoA synthase